MAGQLERATTGAHGIFGELFALFAIKDVYQAETLSGAATLSDKYPAIVGFDPGGAHRDVTLDAEATAKGMLRLILNKADAGENLVIKADGGATIATANQSEAALLYCDGTDWALCAIFTIAIS